MDNTNNKGWIKLYRKIQDNPIFIGHADRIAVWVWLLLSATHNGCDVMFGGKKIKLKPGQLTTGRRVLGNELGLNENSVQRILKKFEDEELIAQLTDHQCRLITIVNWDSYQANEMEVNNGFYKNTQKNKKSEQQTNNEMNNEETSKTIGNPFIDGFWCQPSEQRFEQEMNNDRTTSEQRVNTKQECKNEKNRGAAPKLSVKAKELDAFYKMAEDWANDET